VAISGVITNSLYTPPVDLAANTTWHWRVRAINTAGDASAWSLVRYFRTAILPPVLRAPANGSTAPSLIPIFDWDNVTGAYGYTIQISKNNTFTLLVSTANISGGTSSQFIPTVNLPVNTLLYWRVLASGQNGPSLWSSPVRSFTTPNPPYIPVPSSPLVNALVTDLRPVFQWSRPYIPAGTVFDHYQVQIATDMTFLNVVQDVNISGYSTSTYTPVSTLASNTKYYWRVRASNTLGHFSSWSTAYYFRTALPTPLLVSPVNGGTTNLYRPPFDWSDVPGVTNYTIQVSQNNTFTLLWVNATSLTSNYTPLVNLPANIPLYWRVRTNGANGPSLWSSPVWSLTVKP
jgi:hypothetical protein